MSVHVDLQQAKHVFQAMILTVIADREPDLVEAGTIATLRREYPVIAAVPRIGDVGRELRNRYLHIGMQATATAIANGIYDREYRELAFVLCAKVMLADGETDLEEAEVLGLFQELFGFTADDVKHLIKRATTGR